jgi:hypothetical protein
VHEGRGQLVEAVMTVVQSCEREKGGALNLSGGDLNPW